MKSFMEAKQEYDNKMKGVRFLPKSLVPVHGKIKENIRIRNEKGEKLEEYYKWQFIYSLIASGLYSKDYIGVEVYFPKGNPKSKPLKIDGAIFDDKNWINYYKKVWPTDNSFKRDQEALDWLRKHLIAVIEFKKEDGKDIEKYVNQQLKPAMKESEKEFVIGFYYDTERVWIFQKKNNKILRYDESKNQKGDKSTIKDLSLDLPDSYLSIPSFSDILSVINRPSSIDRSRRTLNDLDAITGIHSKQINDAMSNILRTLDKVGLVNQRGYELLIQVLALKIFDEKANEKNPKRFLKFYITEEEKHWKKLSDPKLQEFIKRLKSLYDEAKGVYYTILKNGKDSINWKDKSHVQAVISIVENFQDYSFVKSYKTDLYQLVFYRFANEFAKEQKGQFITPIPLIDFLVKIVNPRNGETVIDPTVGIADFLSLSYVNSQSKLDDANLYGIDNDQQMIMLAQLNMLLNGDGNAKLYYIPDKGSITHKINIKNEPVELDYDWFNNYIKEQKDKYGKEYLKYVKWWDEIEWPDGTEIKKFDVVLTNPPFGEDRKIEPKNETELKIVEMYELWHIARAGNWIDPGIIFLENAIRLLKPYGRIGIVQSNSIASIDRWEKARKWLMDKVRIVALFDLPPNVFADTGVNTTLIVAYKPPKNELEKLKEQDYEIFIKEINKVGYEVRTSKRVKYYRPLYKRNPETFEIVTDENGNPVLDEEFTQTIKEFREWALMQEEKLKELFIGER